MSNTSQNAGMKVLLLPLEAFKYLEYVFETHMQAGIPSQEVFAAADLKNFLSKAQTVDFSKLGKADIDKLGKTGVALNLKPEEEPSDYIHEAPGGSTTVTD
jgi:hypothetical protein